MIMVIMMNDDVITIMTSDVDIQYDDDFTGRTTAGSTTKRQTNADYDFSDVNEDCDDGDVCDCSLLR